MLLRAVQKRHRSNAHLQFQRKKNIFICDTVSVIFNVILMPIHLILLLKTEQNIYWQNKLLHNL